MLDYSLITDVVLDGIDHSDHPDYCDAYIVSAKYDDIEMTEEEIEELNDDSEFVLKQVMDYIY